METKWLEDFVSLAETRSFSRSAQLRHVTQYLARRYRVAEGDLTWEVDEFTDRDLVLAEVELDSEHRHPEPPPLASRATPGALD